MSKMKKTKDIKGLDYYLNLPWTYTIETEIHEGSSYYIIHVNELPGICTDSKSLDEGMSEIKNLIACAIEIYQEKGEPVPEPIDRDHFKGKISYRTNSERHYIIAKTAQRMHKSISKTLDTIIDKGLDQLKAI
jgi:predicted RNase H-like HicB family nuclease